MCSVQHMIQSATDTRSRGSASVSSADFYMLCMFARVPCGLCGVCRMVVDVCILDPSGMFEWSVSFFDHSVSFLPSSLIIIHNVPYIMVHLLCTPLLSLEGYGAHVYVVPDFNKEIKI